MDSSQITILVAILSVCAAIITTILTGGFKILEIWYQNRIKNIDKKNKTPLGLVAKYSMDIDQILFDILKKTKCDRVFFARFHNGGAFIDNIPMDKFSVTNEVHSIGYSKISHVLQNILLSTRAPIMYELLYMDEFLRPDTNDGSDLLKIMFDDSVKSVYMFLIRDLDDMPIGFIEISYMKDIHELGLCDILFIKKQHNDILRLAKYCKGNDSK